MLGGRGGERARDGRPCPEDDVREDRSQHSGDEPVRPLRPGGPVRGVPGGARGGAAGRARRRPPFRSLLLGVLALLLAFLVLPAAAARATDWLWFREIGYERVFLLKIAAQWALGLVAGLGSFAVLYLNGRVALRGEVDDAIKAIERGRVDAAARAAVLTPLARTLLLPVAAVLAALTAIAAAGQWRMLVQFQHRSPFGVADQVFGRDVAYYVFTLPAIEAALSFTTLAITLSFAPIALGIYLARGDIRVFAGRLRVAPRAAVHLGVLVALHFVATALRMLLVGVPGVLYASHAPLQGASYTDLHVRVPMLRATALLALVAAAYVLWAAWRGRFGRTAVLTLVGLAVTSVLLVGVVPAVFQRLVVQPNELAREAPQIRHHIEATRRAWGLDSVQRRELDAEQGLTPADVAANQATISNVRLWDREPLLQTFGQIQSIRTYYDFVAVDDDRYRIGGELRQVMLSARELNTAALPTRTFINEHLTFTHGMGLTLGPSNQVTPVGLPVLWVKDLPPASEVEVRVTRPQIYFGELSDAFVLAPTRQREFDYPAGEGDQAVYSQYEGRAGVPVPSFGRRLLFALRFRSLNILLSSDLTADTRVLFHRNVRERAQLALPFLRFDEDPYLVVTDSGHLKWVLDAYTTTDRYPYAQRLADGTSYMRNSVKVVIDAYDGDVRAYLADPADPMIRTLSRIYPGLLRPLAEMPADLRAHLRYPQDLFRVQTALYATFHMTDPETFYHREDQWQVPASQGGDEGEGFMRHIVMRLPGEAEPEFILMRPFTPRQKDNLAAWMVARNDGEHYGELVAYRFPRQSLVFGPAQIVNRINQDTEVARQVSLWDQRGSEVIRGELLVIPIEGSLIYVQPLYLRAEGGRIPELKRVIVAHENRVAMEETLDAGLRRLFGDAAAATTVPVTAPGDATDASPTPATGAATAAPVGAATGAPDAATAALVRQAVEHYERARAAQRADDWATYGAEMRRLGEVLTRLRDGGAP
jgi:uncharacterized membrane protein (UPF0182 family)